MNRVQRWATARRTAGRSGWRGTDALFRGAIGGLGLVGVGVVAHRIDLVLIGAPLLLGTIAALAVPTGPVPAPKLERLPAAVESGDRTKAAITVAAGPGVEYLAIRLPSPDHTAIGPVHLLPGSATTIRAALRWNAWGEGVDLRPDHLAASRDALLINGPVVGAESRRTVLPPITPLAPGPLPPRASGLVGAHRARRPGDGVELRAVRPFQPGDRLRRIDWRVTLRAGAATGEPLAVPHVRERHAEVDADLVLVLDSLVDVGADLGEWSTAAAGVAVRPGGSLDRAVRSAASLAAGYLRQGDRVGLVDLGRPQLSVPPGVGHRQLVRVRHQLVACTRTAGWATRPVLLPKQIPRGAVVVFLSPFLDDATVTAATATARRHLVIAVDTLPAPLLADPSTPWGEVVRLVVAGEHRARRNALRANGVAVVDSADAVASALRRVRS
ncbi:DUF58 domain-containing protein [Actinokineospora diospyrosa]|uniref:Uncharacterized conserved protein, DUF58 family, contains vWF domain n=1 Tax=Actinokineospora diospyrosa TaxID=103728 RepID=A0ABT1IG63_9PSEU|nr:DUF58 domain-containing protein [Actinokineospora diospyrosa]MCP2271622.1 Uncharacterized conserved protein, DUF58 family, contains vWF domain [Actinokineospora diospyrosa]